MQRYSRNGSLAQQWQFENTSGGYCRVGNRNNSAQVWDVAGSSTGTADFGPNVHVFDPSMPASQIQSRLQRQPRRGGRTRLRGAEPAEGATGRWALVATT